MRITIFSPNAVGRVDNRSSTSSPSWRLVLIRPSCGRRFFRHVHAAENLQPAGDRCIDRGRQLVNMVQHAVDAKPYETLVAAGLDVDIAGALLEGVVEQPVDDVDHVGIIGVRRLELPEFQKLLEVGDGGDFASVPLRPGHRTRHGVELERIAGDVRRVGRPHV